MNLVFLSSFEKTAEDTGVISSAQVGIAEEAGEWRVWWHESGEEEEQSAERESWYAGSAWDDMLAEFRLRIAVKRLAGYRPLVELPAGSEPASAARVAFIRKLEYYGEQHADPELYETLRRWRNGQAASEGKSPFIIASNRLLKMVSAFKPYTLEELRQIPGFGEQRVGLYGEGILAATSETSRSTTFPLDWVDGAIDEEETEQWVRQRLEQRRKDGSAKSEAKLKLKEAIAAGMTLGELEPMFSLSRRELVTRIEELDKEGCELEPLLAAELGQVPQTLLDRAWREFAVAGDRFLRPVLQRIYDVKTLDEAALGRAYEWLRLLRIRFRNTKVETGEPAVEEPGQELPEQTA